MTQEQIKHFEKIISSQLARVELMKAEGGFIDYSALDRLIVGVCGGDGIGPEITAQGERVLRFLLADELAAGRVEIRRIDG